MKREEQRSLAEHERKSLQLQRLNQLLEVAASQEFYRQRLADLQLPLESLDQLVQLPLLTKQDLIAGRREPAKIFQRPRSEYRRLHQTSGTTGFPMAVLDTAADWQWWLDCWDFVLDAAEVTCDDVAMMAFSFGPFIGFWTANDALVRRGATVVPGGGMTSENRLHLILDYHCSVICCTPTYALHLASVAASAGIDLQQSNVRRIIVAGEPGGSIPSIRNRIETAWNAKVVDHTGASELGAWGFGSPDGKGIHVIETEFVAELLRFDEDYPQGQPVAEGEEAELVLTNLGRYGGPAIRYRTGDIVRGYRQHDHECRFLWLQGGVLGRADDMMVIRGVNVFPSSVEAIVREVEPTTEFRMIVTNEDEMDQLEIEIESNPTGVDRIAKLLRDRLAMRIEVRSVDDGTLPRFEAKAKRLVDHRKPIQRS